MGVQTSPANKALYIQAEHALKAGPAPDSLAILIELTQAPAISLFRRGCIYLVLAGNATTGNKEYYAEFLRLLQQMKEKSQEMKNDGKAWHGGIWDERIAEVEKEATAMWAKRMEGEETDRALGGFDELAIGERGGAGVGGNGDLEMEI